jgi:hypothetical protein
MGPPTLQATPPSERISRLWVVYETEERESKSGEPMCVRCPQYRPYGGEDGKQLNGRAQGSLWGAMVPDD